MSHVSIIVGARPNFVKIARLIPALHVGGFETRLVHTGQHYDERMSDAFFADLEIPQPDVNLGVGSGTHIWQISEVMRHLEREFTEFRPAAVLVVGDVNSTLAATLAGCKLEIPVGHVEAGLRSFDRTMPEEINRLLTDSVSTWLFTSEPSANENLAREGASPGRIHFVGNVMIDTLCHYVNRARELEAYHPFGFSRHQYAVLTLHRPSNVDNMDRFRSILTAVAQIAKSLPVLMPVHPRTRNRLKEFGEELRIDTSGIKTVEPLGYLTMLGLMDAARVVLTDSGGMQEETTALRVPCLTLRENTERPVTIQTGSNRLVGWRAGEILEAAQGILSGPLRSGAIPEKWDGAASSRIAGALKQELD